MDLGFFRATQTLHEQAPKIVDESMFTIHKAFKEYPSDTIILILQSCMIKVMKAFAGFNYKILHLNKEKMMKSFQYHNKAFDGYIYIDLCVIFRIFNGQGIRYFTFFILDVKRTKRSLHEDLIKSCTKTLQKYN